VEGGGCATHGIFLRVAQQIYPRGEFEVDLVRHCLGGTSHCLEARATVLGHAPLSWGHAPQ